MKTLTAAAIEEKLPFPSQVNRWGKKIYFSVPVTIDLEPRARDVLERGEIAYWPPGKAMAIFFRTHSNQSWR